MKFAKLASLVAAAALALPLAGHAADGKARTWVKDSVVTTKVKAQLAGSKVTSLATVHVDTDADGWVQLTGKVPNQAEKDRAESIAKAVEGVKSVDNQLVVAPK